MPRWRRWSGHCAMRVLSKRLEALEALQTASPVGRIDLDALTDADLDRLEAIALIVEGGQSIESLPDDDLQFVASLRVIA